jgi:hypothetical protein
MADRHIIFQPPLVRALLAGRKTQTRRVLKPQQPTPEQFRGSSFGLDRAVADGVKVYSQNDHPRLPKHPTKWDLLGSVGVARDAGFPTIYGVRFAVGDRLWVREAWRAPARHDHLKPSQLARGMTRAFEADDEQLIGHGEDVEPFPIGQPGRYRQARFMPRWASRLTLIVTDVRVQRLQDISEEDALAEGIFRTEIGDGYAPRFHAQPASWGDIIEQQATCSTSACDAFRDLWNSINAKRAPWDTNPWVTALTFTVHRANIDGLPAPSLRAAA